MYESRVDLSAIVNMATRIRTEIGKRVIGQQQFIDLLILSLLADGHVLIEGVPGVAKTLSAKLLARSVDVGFSRIQFTPDLMPSDILGTSVFNPKDAEFTFKSGPIFSNLVLIDEVNRAPAKTQSALFEVMEERQVTFDGTRYLMDEPFLVLATQNPLEHEGTYRLPEAQLDRFLVKVEVGYPAASEEVEMLTRYQAGQTADDLDDIEAVVTAEHIAQARAAVASVHVEPEVLQYIVALVGQTRNHPMLSLGASPRASIALLATSRAQAALNGRDFVQPEDVQQLLAPVLRHRIMLTPEQEMEGQRPDDAIRRIVEAVEVPR
ncbi:MAG: MoxR family ATPase [Rhodothermales bacterium]